jgi:hypothetical protein
LQSLLVYFNSIKFSKQIKSLAGGLTGRENAPVKNFIFSFWQIHTVLTE